MAKLTLDITHLIRQCPECSRRYSRDAGFCPFDGARLTDAQRLDDKLDPLIGKTIDGRYAVDRVLGEGGMGTVYRAHHVALGRPLALKVLRADLSQEADLAARFIQEGQAAAAIKHPNIVAITDFGRLPDQRPYLVMELLSGRTLASLLAAGGALPPREAARIAIAVASGLAAAHAAGIVHRDLKPENIFLLGESRAELRVVDFGAAMIIGASRLTKAGVVFGTPYYMSPEQAAGKPVDHRADVYALGIILYEMITGRVPFEGDTYMGVLTQHIFVAPRAPSELVPELGGKLGAIEGIVLRALEKEPDARFGGMDELESALKSALEARGVSPSWPSPPHVASAPPRGIADDLELPTAGEIRERLDATERDARRGRTRKVAMAVIAGSAVVLGISVGVRVYSANQPSQPAPNPRASSVGSGAATVSAPLTAQAASSVPQIAESTTTATASASALVAPPVAPHLVQTTTKKLSGGPARTQKTLSPPSGGSLGPDPFEH